MHWNSLLWHFKEIQQMFLYLVLIVSIHFIKIDREMYLIHLIISTVLSQGTSSSLSIYVCEDSFMYCVDYIHLEKFSIHYHP